MFEAEGVESPEREREIETRIILELMRHGKKEEDNEKKDNNMRLTKEGRKQADEKGERLDPQARVSLGRGSAAERTRETAYRAMLANEDIDPDDSLEKIEEKISKELKFGKKMVTDKRLIYDDTGPIGEELVELGDVAWVIKESDKKAIEAGDKVSSTYMRFAGNIADLVNRYAKIGDNFNRIASKSDKYEEFGNQLERYLGTHQSVIEGFLAKVLEKTKGKEKRDEFAKLVGDGFDETEGIRIEIANKGSDQKISLTYNIGDKKETIGIDRKLLEDIIEERNLFEKQIS